MGGRGLTLCVVRWVQSGTYFVQSLHEAKEMVCIRLRACYAMAGTDVAYGATTSKCICAHVCYADKVLT